MKFFEPTEKRNTVALYSFFVALFCVLCVIIGINIRQLPRILTYIYEIVKPIIYGLIIAFLLHPIVSLFETKILRNHKEKKIGFRHFISVVLAYVLVIALITLFAATVIPQIVDNYGAFESKFFDYIEIFRNRTAEMLNSRVSGESIYLYLDTIPDLRRDLSDGLFSVTLRSLDGVQYAAKSTSVIIEVRDIFDDALTAIGEMISSSLPTLFSSALAIITETKNIILGFFISLYFLLGERKHIMRIKFVLKAWMSKKMYTRIAWLSHKAKNIFRDYVVVRLLDGLIIGVLLFIGLSIFRTPYAVLLSVIMGVASFFPFIGPVIGVASGTFILLLVDPKYALLYLVISALLNIIDSRYIETILNYGRDEYTLPAMWVFAAIVIMGGFFGVVGILIGIPLFAFIYSIIKELCSKKLISKKLSADTRDYFVTETESSKNDESFADDVLDMRSYYDERRETETEIVDTAKQRFTKLVKVLKREKNEETEENEEND